MKSLLIAVLTSFQLFACGGSPGGLVVHEWGTFTSVQGSDGVPIQWNPLVTSELPSFVHDLNRPTADPNRRKYSFFAGKTAMLALQRMETPVLYFYSKEPLTVDVRVDFPQGVITEWYPQAAEIGALMRSEAGYERPKSSLFWRGVEILDGNKTVTQFPQEQKGSHYYAARATEANPLRVTAESKGGVSEQEKFLFYRGVGHFQTPLATTPDSSGSAISLRNQGDSDLKHLFVLRIHQGRAEFLPIPALKVGEAKSISLKESRGFDAISSFQEAVATEIEKALVAEGLFRPEAKSMVATWKDSWFTEEGLRVLYLLPGDWTDRTLPLQVTPAASRAVRVMVGRNEVITFENESALRSNIIGFSKAKDGDRAEIIAATSNLHLGRFLEAATRRVLGKTPSKELSQAAWNLMEAVNKTEKEKQVAVR